MNSLPFISHHLFVAAIGNEVRDQADPAPPERPFAEPVEHASVMALELMNAEKLRSESATQAARPRSSHALT